MIVEYSNHLKQRLELRKFPENLPKLIFEFFDEKYFDHETGNFIAIKKVKYRHRTREVMIAYTGKNKIVEILTIHPLKKSQKANRINNKRWKKL